MASLLSGPRLGCPSPTGFSVWARCDASALVELQVRVTGATDWTSQGSATTDATLYETVVLYATGLQHTTKYDYRLLVDGVEACSYWTVTMPPDGGGRFIAYQLCDPHFSTTAGGLNPDIVASMNAYRYVWTYHQANHPGIPAVAFTYGDLVVDTFDFAGSGMTWPEWYATQLHTFFMDPALTGGAIEFFHYIPLLYMWDDWDFLGNNSDRDWIASFPASGRTPADAAIAMNVAWRDQPQPALPSFGYSLAIAGVPFIVADSRSQKASPYLKNPHPLPAYFQRLFNDESPQDYGASLWGTAQATWLREQLGTYASRALVIFIATHSLVDSGLTTRAGAGAPTGTQRDSGGIYHAPARNYVFDAARIAGYGWRRNLMLWSGDDHYNCVFDDDFHEAKRQGAGGDYPAVPFGVPHLDFKVATRQCTDLSFRAFFAKTPTWFHYSTSISDGNPSCFVRWDINSANSGEHVRARATYVVASLQTAGNLPFGQPYTVGDTLLEPRDHALYGDLKYPTRRATGDFWFQDGKLSYYEAGVSGVQQHPGSSGPGPAEFRETYADEILGTYRKRDEMLRNSAGELRQSSDPEDIDRDDLRIDWQTRVESATEEEP